MKIIFLIITIATLTLGDATFLLGDEISFRCKVKAAYDLADDGKLIESGMYLESTFTVERSTGNIIGGSFNNKGDYQIKVVDSGLAGSYKVFSYSPGRRIAESLAIITRAESEKKPFVGIDYLQIIVTGTCD